jgi:hypothetical protein
VPDAATVKGADCPTATVWLDGCPVMDGESRQLGNPQPDTQSRTESNGINDHRHMR